MRGSRDTGGPAAFQPAPGPPSGTAVALYKEGSEAEPALSGARLPRPSRCPAFAWARQRPSRRPFRGTTVGRVRRRPCATRGRRLTMRAPNWGRRAIGRSRVASRTAFLSAVVALGSVRCVSDFVSSPATNQVAASVAISPAGPDTLTALGDARAYTAQAKDSSGNPIPNPTYAWSSTSSTVATVSGDGQASAAGNGTATIQATVQGVTGTVTLVVRQAANSASIAPGTFTLAVLGSQALGASAIDANGNVVTRALPWSWQSS